MERFTAWWSARPMWQKIAIVVLGIGLVAAALTEDETSESPRATTRTTASPASTASSRYSDHDPEYLLAAIDKGSLNVSDPEVAPYERVLDRLEPKCTENRELIGDMAVRSLELLADEGVVSETTLTMMEAVDLSIPADLGEQPCADIYATLLVLMTSE